MDRANNPYTGAVGDLLSPPSNLMPPRVSSSGSTSFPIIAVAVIGILATAFLLISYYVLVIKCCLNWHRIDLLRRFNLSRPQNDQNPSSAYSPEIQNRGLDDSVIRAIPVFKFKKRGRNQDSDEKNSLECAVCLNEFQDEEKVRIVPNCCHMFHIDCIDVWFQNNSNCPLCRTSVSLDAQFSVPFVDAIPPPNSSPETIVRGEQDYIVIELDRNSKPNPTIPTLIELQESPNPIESNRNPKRSKFNKVMSMGDECINIRGTDNDEFKVQPIRRSISMDSSADRQLCLAVQEEINCKNQKRSIRETCCMEGCSNGKVKRSFFSFGSGRSSRSTVLPVVS